MTASIDIALAGLHLHAALDLPADSTSMTRALTALALAVLAALCHHAERRRV